MNLYALQTGFREWLTSEAKPGGLGAARFEAGLGIYLNNYRAQLMDCLHEAYGTVHAWLGDAAFAGAAAAHIDTTPPRSWTLDAYGDDFAHTLRTLYPEDPEVGDLADLERALAQAFTAPDCNPLDPDILGGTDWDSARLRFVPSLALLPTVSNAGAIWSAIARNASPPSAQALSEPVTTLVWREGFTPAFRTLEPVEAQALAGLMQRSTFGAICAGLVQREGGEAGPALLGAYLCQWLADGIIAGISDESL